MVDSVDFVLNKLLPDDRSRVVEIPFEEKKTSIERAIFRLVLCGVAKDYEVDFGSKKFIVHVNPVDIESCKSSALKYITSSQPGRRLDMKRRLDEHKNHNLKAQILAIIKTFIEFIYDVIERSRRRSLQESIHAVRDSTDGLSFRRRLLDYLQEGVDVEAFESLINKESIDFNDWISLIDKVGNAIEPER